MVEFTDGPDSAWADAFADTKSLTHQFISKLSRQMVDPGRTAGFKEMKENEIQARIIDKLAKEFSEIEILSQHQLLNDRNERPAFLRPDLTLISH